MRKHMNDEEQPRTAIPPLYLRGKHYRPYLPLIWRAQVLVAVEGNL